MMMVYPYMCMLRYKWDNSGSGGGRGVRGAFATPCKNIFFIFLYLGIYYIASFVNLNHFCSLHIVKLKMKLVEIEKFVSLQCKS